jgi:hypothetical protein
VGLPVSSTRIPFLTAQKIIKKSLCLDRERHTIKLALMDLLLLLREHSDLPRAQLRHAAAACVAACCNAAG